MQPDELLRYLKGGLIVSCQPDADHPQQDPMNRPEIMAALAQSAVLGGAVAIRADGSAHIAAIRAVIAAPVIGIYKHDRPGFAVRITPTVEDALAVALAGADFIAVDATARTRPEGHDAAEFINLVIAATGKPVMADVATLQEGILAAQAGACAVITTLSGYTGSSPQQQEPDYELIIQLTHALRTPVIAEGRINTPAQALRALQSGAWAVTVGSAITRPRSITEKFSAALSAR
jgi:N-acylglucosamine-6-phosphate 2-epimerase